MRRFARRLASVGTLIAMMSGMVLIQGSGSAWANVTSLADAQAQGDPAADASTAYSESDDGYVYQGKPVTAKVILAKSLSCLSVDRGPSRCYDSPEQLQEAEVPARQMAAARSMSPAILGGDCSIWAVQFVWTGASFSGASSVGFEEARWANLGSPINNEGSSFAMGMRPGHFADLQNGVGYWYPGDTTACAIEGNLNRNGLGWNNRISSRYSG